MSHPAPSAEPFPGGDQERLWAGDLADGAPADPDAAAPDAAADELHGAPDELALPPRTRRSRTGGAGAWSRSLGTRAPLPAPGGLAYAEVPDRIIAFVLDVIVLAVVGVVLALVLGGAFGGMTGGSPAGGSLDAGRAELNVGAFVVVGVAALAAGLAYFTYCWVVLRATPGMRLLGLRIGDERDGHPISWNQAIVRWLLVGIAATLLSFVVYVPSLLGLLLGLVALLWLSAILYTTARSTTKQGLHDRYARTILVRAMRRAR